MRPGFKKILLEPYFVGGLDQFEATHESRYSKIISSWKRSGNKIIYTVVIPPNTTARIRLNKDIEVAAGRYEFEIK